MKDDEDTRDTEIPDMKPEGRWFTGPTFITCPEDTWPREKEPTYKPNNLTLEVKLRLIRSTAWVLRFIRRCRMGPLKLVENQLQADEIKAQNTGGLKILKKIPSRPTYMPSARN